MGWVESVGCLILDLVIYGAGILIMGLGELREYRSALPQSLRQCDWILYQPSLYLKWDHASKPKPPFSPRG